ncbi:MAG: UvrD-helicase domain-containing protein [Chitinophagales bacterium]|nr:UvrD-helicase domain-containing protein [Chitinophagales bacterium]
MEKFDVKEVKLEGSHLIEASAGTGKTYSIAILVLRLIIEKEIPIQEILMVTFTKAAVAELEERVRKFVREAYRYSLDEEETDKTISFIVDRYGKGNAREKLKTALLFLDEISVLTIHGFSQQTLNEYAFETQQVFRTELMSDTSELIEQEIQAFWRNNITTIMPELLEKLLEINISQEGIKSILKGHLEGKRYIFYSESKSYQLDKAKQDKFYKDLIKSEEEIKRLEDKIWNYLQENKTSIVESLPAKNTLSPVLDNQEDFLKELIKKIGTTKYIQKAFTGIISEIEQLVEWQDKDKLNKEKCMNHIYSCAIYTIIPEIDKQKTAYDILTFDDMIGKLNLALTTKENLSLVKKLRTQYQAVFIDEFQDTDRQQYEIFYTAFQKQYESIGHSNIIFYIGDPKQSIYGWRKADIQTYLKAKANVNKVYTMDINYRSSFEMVQALNKFFLPETGFDTFHFGDEKEPNRFDYVNVFSNKKENEVTIQENKENFESNIPLHLIKVEKKTDAYSDMTNRIIDLLNEGEIDGKEIKASDIGILVRGNSDAADIKKALSKKGIPAVVFSDTKVLESKEATEMVYILEAIIYSNISNVNRALVTDYVGYETSTLLNYETESDILQFKKYHGNWKKDGIYSILTSFATDYQLQNRLIEQHTEVGERILTNFFHLAELLYKIEIRQKLQPLELLNWLKLTIQKQDKEGDEWIQRIESDAEAVNIMTIHKSKGLEYSIVFAPSLDFRFKDDKERVYGFRNEENNYVTAKISQLEGKQLVLLKNQEEQENRRLLYVTLTRAKYKCFVYSVKSKKVIKGVDSTLNVFLKKLENNFTKYINELSPVSDNKKYQKAQTKSQKILNTKNFRIGYPWKKLSYSSLIGEKEWIPKEVFKGTDNNYEKFIFKDLSHNAKVGTFLHELFEKIHFNEDKSWKRAIDYHLKSFISKPTEDFTNGIEQLISHVMHAQISAGQQEFSLCNLDMNKTLHEMEFNYPLKLFTPQSLVALQQEDIVITDRQPKQLEGMMNGFVDLFFEYNNQYYILDWKSNYLGANIEDYNSGKLYQVMTDNNYHLQYLIYTHAIHKYLTQKLGNQYDYERNFGGVIYIFLRGARAGEDSGIFYTKPKFRQIETMEGILCQPQN